ncbi:MAG: ferritin-like domain-containing protein [Nostocales cyanobacterium 94392]|nr:ferritin-like domain-containing protein [Nostocales cyanobacterium 94392]
MNQQYSIAGLHLPNINQQDKLSRILSSALEKTEENLIKISEPLLPYWNAQYFNLDNVKIFQYSTPAEKSSILQLCNLGILEEAYFIEKAGVGYMAKMILLAETTEERMLYALFAADEATHLSQISRFLSIPELSNNPFLSLLEEVVENDDKTVLLFVLQVILEGWGLTHYRSIAQGCQNSQLSSVIRGFLQDESRHHATGVTLFEKISSSKLSPDIIHILAKFLQMVQLGPQSVVTAIEQVKGHLSKVEKIKIFEQLNTENHSGSRLKLLRSLMHSPNATNIVDNLQIKGCFQPLKANQCVLIS